jgi:hypothetical protein
VDVVQGSGSSGITPLVGLRQKTHPNLVARQSAKPQRESAAFGAAAVPHGKSFGKVEAAVPARI